MISVLEHLPKPQLALNEAYRITKHKGSICLITVQNYILHDAPYDYFRYTKYSLEKMLNESGFTITKIQSLGNYFELTGQYFNVFLLYRIKSLVNNKSIQLKILGFTLLCPIGIICIFSNILVYILNFIFKSNDNGEFAIYNLAIAKNSNS